jgi:hypothetical protein
MLPVIFSILQTRNKIKCISIVLFVYQWQKVNKIIIIMKHFISLSYRKLYIILQKTVFHYLKIFLLDDFSKLNSMDGQIGNYYDLLLYLNCQQHLFICNPL